MVAVIGSGVSIRRAFLYNEHKVDAGKAVCLMAQNYPMDLKQMNQNERLKMLLKTAERNLNVKRPSIHISLNFAPGEKLSDKDYCTIADEYIGQIGFAGQPFLVYRHDDAAHPHIHIVTTKIRPDGSRIETQNIGKLRSEPARKAIEKRYGLVSAEHHQKEIYALKPVNASRVNYGEESTKKAIEKVLQYVLANYRYTSLSELNAVLVQYNIRASSGGETSRVFRHGGLVYQVLDGTASPIGIPVKASLFYNNPGLKFLSKQYLANDVARAKFRDGIKATIDLTILRNPKVTLEKFIEKLRGQGIYTVLRRRGEGQIYGITYVDHKSRCVFNGSALGKNYSAKAIQERFGPPHTSIPKITVREELKEAAGPIPKSPPTPKIPIGQAVEQPQPTPAEDSVIEQLMGYEYADQGVPFQWKKKKKRKKRR